MRIDVITLFPAMFQGPLTESILARAQKQGILEIMLHDLRTFGFGRYRQVDDAPYGGGAGMVMRVDVVASAVETILGKGGNAKMRKCENAKMTRRILFSARGERLTQEKVEELSTIDHLLLVCGRYEGVDQRIVEGGWIDEEISIGDYVLTGGEIPAMVLIDAVARQIPGVLGKEGSYVEESFSAALGRKREYPHYTRPEEFRGLTVPSVLRSGNHQEIERWRKSE